MNQKDQTLIRIGMTESHDCSYLDEHQERVAVVLDDVLHTCSGYELLILMGFAEVGMPSTNLSVINAMPANRSESQSQISNHPKARNGY